jgi:hypothetical protein
MLSGNLMFQISREVFMSEQELAAKLDAALAQVDPSRRKFLGILLAGVAAAPLLNSASLAAENKPAGQKAEVFPKNATSVKGSTALKNNSGIKNDAVIKNSSNSGIKSSNGALKNSSGANTQLKFDGVNNNKANTGAIKSQTSPSSGAHKNDSAIKNSSGATKLDANANSSKIK